MLKWQIVDGIEFFLRERGCRWILNPITGVLALRQAGCAQGIVVPVKGFEHINESALIGGHDGVSRKLNITVRDFTINITNSGKIPEIRLGFQMPRKKNNRFFRHAIDEEIRFGIKKNGSSNDVGPEVVVGHAPKTGLYPPQDEGSGGFEIPANQVGIGNHRAVRA